MVENRAHGGFAAVSTGEHPVNGGTALFYEHHKVSDTVHSGYMAAMETV